jgi:hypothetical protein
VRTAYGPPVEPYRRRADEVAHEAKGDRPDCEVLVRIGKASKICVLRLDARYRSKKWANMSLWSRVFWKQYALVEEPLCQILVAIGRRL